MLYLTISVPLSQADHPNISTETYLLKSAFLRPPFGTFGHSHVQSFRRCEMLPENQYPTSSTVPISQDSYVSGFLVDPPLDYGKTSSHLLMMWCKLAQAYQDIALSIRTNLHPTQFAQAEGPYPVCRYVF